MASDLTGTRVTTNRKWLAAALVLLTILLVGFAPAFFGGRSLLLASWDAPSVMSSGAYDQSERPFLRLARTADPGAPAWQSEAWFKLISNELWGEFSLPLWNPYNAYGTPLAASMQPQPFFPPATLLSLHVTPWTYSLFIVGRLFLGGILTFFFARQFLSALPSLFASVTFMLSGYFIIYLNMPHLSVEVLTPGLFLTFELLLRRNSWGAVVAAATMIFVGVAGGMPESLFLILAFATLYFVCRLLFTAEFRAQSGQLIPKFLAAVILGIAVSAFILFPFLEFVRLAHDSHQVSNMGGARSGLGADGDYYSTIQYLLPLIFGPILNSIFSDFSGWSGLRGYWGVIPFYFAVVAALLLIVRKGMPRSNSEHFLTIFFATTLILMVLKRYGNVLINWIGYLPLSEMVVYPKYLEPLIAFCVAMLGGLGFAAVAGRRATPRQLQVASVVTLGLMLGLAGSYLPAVRTAVLKSSLFHSLAVKTSLFYYVSVACGVGLLLVLFALLVLAESASDLRRPHLLRGIFVLTSLELLFNFLIPGFYILSSLPRAKADPYAGAPYIDFIRAKNTDHSRVFGRELMLYPNWSAAFGVPDVRNLDALNYRRYRTFVRSFLRAPGDENRQHGELADRFTGGEFLYPFNTDLEKRFLALSSIKYLISESDYNQSSKVLDDIIEQHQGENIRGFAADIFRVGDGETSAIRGLFQHPPSTRIPFRVTIDARQPVLEAVAVIKIEAANRTDGVGFHLEIKDGEKIETLFLTFLDPRDRPADKAGRPFRLDLSEYAGREVELLFSTDPGPKGDVSGDWAGWAGLRFVPKNGAIEPRVYKPIYQKEARVFEVPWVLPRAALYRAIEILPDDAVLTRLKDPAFNPNEKAIVSRESMLAA